MVSFATSSMVLFNGILPKLGFFLAQLCLDTQVRGQIGKNVAFASSSIARKTMVEMLYRAPQWEILNVYHAPSNTWKLVVEYVDTIE